jgi:hypothetical protein
MDIFPKIPPGATFSQIEIVQAANPDSLHVICEGADDRDFLEGLFLGSTEKASAGRVKWVIGHGRPYCLKIHRLCVERGKQRVLFVVDADYDRKLNVLQPLEAVAYTDRNDMECTVLAIDPVLDRLQEQYAGKETVQRLLDATGHSSVFALAVDRASRMGRYRFIDKRDKLSLRFKNPKPDVEPPYDTFLLLDAKFSWNDTAFREWLLQRNQNAGLEVAKLFERVDQLPQTEEDNLDWCQGHDLIALHAVIHNHIIAKVGGETIDSRRLEGLVRRNVEPSRVRAAEVIRRLEAFVGWELLSCTGAAAGS